MSYLCFMILYNVSIIVEDSSHDQVVEWLKSRLLQNSYETNFLKMLESPHEGSTYCIQFVAPDDTVISKFQQDVLVDLQAYLATHHNGKAFLFDSKMQYLSLE